MTRSILLVPIKDRTDVETSFDVRPQTNWDIAVNLEEFQSRETGRTAGWISMCESVDLDGYQTSSHLNVLTDYWSGARAQFVCIPGTYHTLVIFPYYKNLCDIL